MMILLSMLAAAGICQAGWLDFNKNGVLDPYEDASRPVEERVDDLVAQMTVEEKTCQLATLYGTGRVLEEAQPCEAWKTRVWKDGIANIDEQLNGVGSAYVKHYDLIYPFSSHARALNAIQRWFVDETRLGIPVDFTNEGIHGLNHTKATPLPAPIGVGSTWNRALVRSAGELVGREAKALGYTNIYAPILDLARDPRWGRVLECYGEDPFLVAELGTEMVKGIQSQGVGATLKHFAAYSVPKGGRDGDARTDPHIAPRELHELHLYPFRRVVAAAHPVGVMASYNDWDGIPVAASRWLLTDMLRREYGFDGYVVSDSAAVEFVHDKHNVARDYGEGAAMCLTAGLNVRTHFTPPEDFIGHVREEIRAGRLSMETVDERVREVLRVKFRLGLFDHPYVENPEAADGIAGLENNADFADEIQSEAFVLLKNANAALPLDLAKSPRILVAGPLADETDYMTSRYGPNGLDVVSVLRGIREYVGARAQVDYAKGCETVDRAFPDSEIVPRPLEPDEAKMLDDAAAAAARADVVIAVLGENEALAGECHSRTSLDLPGRQQMLLERLCAAGKPVILVLVNGRPLAVNWAERNVDAILEAWFPGARGGVAVAMTLFGEVNPSGRLPVTFPKSIGQIELNFPFKRGSHGGQPATGPNGSGRTRVLGALWPFGFGLSYTTFQYSDMRVEREGEDVVVSCVVENTGGVDGAEVVQLYVRDEFSSVTAYDSVLRGFEKVRLKAGEKRRVTMRLKSHDFAILGRDMRYVVEPGAFRLMLGSSSEDVRLQTTIEFQ